MKQSKLLYGVNSLAPHLKGTSYEQALFTKIVLAQNLLNHLVRVDNMEDYRQVSDVSKAIKFNRELLKELGLSDPDITKKLKEYF